VTHDPQRGRVSAIAFSTVALALFAATAGCGSAPASIDLTAALPSAERRALGPPDDAIQRTTISSDGATRPAIVMAAPSRVLFPVNMRVHARFHAAVALEPGSGAGATVRVGIAGTRSYDELLRIPLTPGARDGTDWQAVDLDLGEYSGWQWSVFYRPQTLTWKFVLNADASPGGRVLWLEPVIVIGR
jgi:hypothetical protein